MKRKNEQHREISDRHIAVLDLVSIVVAFLSVTIMGIAIVVNRNLILMITAGIVSIIAAVIRIVIARRISTKRTQAAADSIKLLYGIYYRIYSEHSTARSDSRKSHMKNIDGYQLEENVLSASRFFTSPSNELEKEAA